MTKAKIYTTAMIENQKDTLGWNFELTFLVYLALVFVIRIILEVVIRSKIKLMKQREIDSEIKVLDTILKHLRLK